MLNKISWGSYCSALAVMIVLYYAFILLKYYKEDLKQLFAKLTYQERFTFYTDHFINNYTQTILIKCLEPELLQPIKYICGEISSAIVKAEKTNSAKEELMMSLQLILHQFPELKDSSIKQDLVQFMVDVSKRYCSVHLNNEEVGVLWIRRDG